MPIHYLRFKHNNKKIDKSVEKEKITQNCFVLCRSQLAGVQTLQVSRMDSRKLSRWNGSRIGNQADNSLLICEVSNICEFPTGPLETGTGY